MHVCAGRECQPVAALKVEDRFVDAGFDGRRDAALAGRDPEKTFKVATGLRDGPKDPVSSTACS